MPILEVIALDAKDAEAAQAGGAEIGRAHV